MYIYIYMYVSLGFKIEVWPTNGCLGAITIMIRFEASSLCLIIFPLPLITIKIQHTLLIKGS